MVLAWLAVLLSQPLLAGPDGAELFSRHCVACHGEEGRGGVGVPLALPAFLESVDDRFLTVTIREGRPGRVMPSFRTLSDAQIQAIVSYIRSWTDRPTPTFDPAPIQGDAQRGARLFASHCAGCHGPEGRGGHGTGVTFSRPRDLPIIAPALRNRGFLAAASDRLIRATLVRGREGTPMVPATSLGLDDRDIDDIVAYIRSLESTLHDERRRLQEKHDAEPTVLMEESSYTLEETVENVKQAIVGKNYRVVRVQRLEEGLVPEDQVNPRQVVVYFCNFNQLNQALAIDPRVGLFLPCRITVVEEKGVVRVYSTNPGRMAHFFNNDELKELCEEMSRTYEEILEEATL